MKDVPVSHNGVTVLRQLAQQVSNWGRWGDDDERGTINIVTTTKVRDAATLVHKGAAFSLSIPLQADGPQSGIARRFNPIHLMLSTGTDALAAPHGSGGFGYADDIVIMPLQCATHWDGLSHVFHDGRMYNGYPADLVDSAGARRNSSDNMGSNVITRGVLLDVASALGVGSLDPGQGIGVAELEATLEHEGVSVQAGDALLIRTGWMSRFLKAGNWEGYAEGECPGLSYSCAPWLREHDVAVVATDTYAAEVKPTELDGVRSPFHLLALVYLGLPIGEIFQLEELAEDCKEDGVYEFMFVAPPLPFAQAVGSPTNPCAIK